MNKIILYATKHCPLCQVLKERLTEANIEYEVETNITILRALNTGHVPVLGIIDEEEDKVDLKEFTEAIKWIKENTKK